MRDEELQFVTELTHSPIRTRSEKEGEPSVLGMMVRKEGLQFIKAFSILKFARFPSEAVESHGVGQEE